MIASIHRNFFILADAQIFMHVDGAFHLHADGLPFS
jgi:hypothetical protein